MVRSPQPTTTTVLEKLQDPEFIEKMQRRCAVLCKNSRFDPKDLAQDVFFLMFKNKHQFKGRSQVKTWADTIALNRYRDLVSSDIVRRHYEENFTPEPQKRQKHPSRFLALKRAFKALPEKQQEIFELRLKGEKIESIAAKLGISIKAVRAELKKAQKSLLESVEDFDL
jgi:RNA polymerase sigma factor (sigma-70 family)